MAVTVGLAAQAAAAQTPPGFRWMAGTSRVAFFSRGGSDFGSRQKTDVKRTDAFLARMERTLAQPLAAPISYYTYERPEDIAAQTGVYAYGLTHVGDSVVHSTATYHPHELVHAVAGGLGDPGRFFHEGLAVALGDEGRWDGSAVDALARARAAGVDRKQLVDAFDRLAAGVAYPVAGSFVKHLIDRDGLPKLVEFFRACPRRVDVDAAFLRTYGRSFQNAFAEWQQSLGA
ncbi:MAG: hypothetical protein ABW221_01895 [Vicinamibacteria bacterium]